MLVYRVMVEVKSLQLQVNILQLVLFAMVWLHLFDVFTQTPALVDLFLLVVLTLVGSRAYPFADQENAPARPSVGALISIPHLT
jgi:hypothetical protein